jgi:hypothetical protein
MRRRSPSFGSELREGGFDAAFLAVGAHIGKRAYIPAEPAGQGARRRLRAAQRGGPGAPAPRPPPRRLTAAGTPPSTWPAQHGAWAPRRPSLSTGGRRGVFAGGDMMPAEHTVTVGISHGKHAARCVDAWLRDAEYEHPLRPDVVAFDDVNPWSFSDPHRAMRPQLDRIRRRSTFDEVSAVSTNPRPSSRPAVACRAATASPATTASACAPTTRSSSSMTRGPTAPRSTSTSARAAACARRSARAARSRWSPSGSDDRGRGRRATRLKLRRLPAHSSASADGPIAGEGRAASRRSLSRLTAIAEFYGVMTSACAD